MVEGPGCKLKGERLARLKGQHVVQTQWGRNRPKRPNTYQNGRQRLPQKLLLFAHVTFASQIRKSAETTGISPVVRDASKGSGVEQEDTTSEKSDHLVGLPLSNVETLGKELFVYFGETCLRVHFGMNGSVQIKGQKNKGFQKTSEPVLTLTLTVDSVSFHDCTVQIRSTSNCHEKYVQFQHLDICSSHFSLSQATRTVSCHGDRMLCDVLLDQTVLPGVGNIIKNEALFDSGLQPSLKVLQLKEEHVKHLVKMTRDFSMLFYKCRKEGRALSRHCKVYNKQCCGQCQGRITVCRMGENGRMTYFCERCQTRDPETIINNKSNGSKVAQGTGRSNTVVCCKLHNKVCVERTVRKKGDNYGRPFFCCSMPRGKQCKFFQWADDNFPLCNHGERCVKRTVLKQGANNGREFYTCRLERGKQCGFFQWV
ncbi:NEIL3 [Branchiostoma lanceolatum]|uniref:Endonuclease 8-like 3 n=1 Tax=Branchiostoma lanceolatum TaxID=7740 RepID=A0A8K0A322_BRALA|nr:NEIL3 [Branchiostoma lanceolatum]